MKGWKERAAERQTQPWWIFTLLGVLIFSLILLGLGVYSKKPAEAMWLNCITLFGVLLNIIANSPHVAPPLKTTLKRAAGIYMVFLLAALAAFLILWMNHKLA